MVQSWHQISGQTDTEQIFLSPDLNQNLQIFTLSRFLDSCVSDLWSLFYNLMFKLKLEKKQNLGADGTAGPANANSCCLAPRSLFPVYEPAAAPRGELSGFDTQTWNVTDSD